MSKLKYLGTYISPIFALISFNCTGFFAYSGVILLYVLVPVLENFIPTNSYNFSKEENKLAKKDWFYDWILYLLVPLHLYVIYVFLVTIANPSLEIVDLIAYLIIMGTILGINGINGGHELGHKIEHPFKMFLARILLTTSFQNHFITYHNGGHHRDVATPNDLTTAKKGDVFYFFAIKSQIGGYFKSWRLEAEKIKSKGGNQLLNPMIVHTIIPWLFLGFIYLFFSIEVTLLYFLAAIFGISILEAQNYFSHYGLKRKQKEDGTYERVKVEHSWNSDHVIGRVFLFELTRHSDHHFSGAKHYQILRSKDESPMLPYGYPAMLILSYFPFLFKPIMEKQLTKYGMN